MGTIKEKVGKLDKGLMHARADVPFLYSSSESPLKCDGCGAHLGLWRMVYHALFKKRGTPYYVICKKCRKVNRRVKGEAGKQLDERWKDID